ncbi:hypothetical protein COT48_04580 [Candidatus Woesearchaeota archaeon CG08_land_8_20_14_0_20_47_9]|nr:MAG: hypothetical protein AUJ69_02725 [Candidatus Woesearchaeota archaeon CG1_02_47_18]PIN74845.1 MAG: hypothetical protein COV22_01020 [Candidatus Woesearchaeota archaeon CG10_big_fil_rev_8_21_14_0_10_47_5]PIO03490.1 MAG: hypothetical protein COT48_04580 [Candidatus Woesearchaeota archaeon CG08_land_8_20_14_0_20_47_9]HII29854.1 hypothetical protein [Candidatus Woesearchaeota archaeon]
MIKKPLPSKSAQISIFIVIGLMLLIVTALFFYTSGMSKGKGIEESKLASQRQDLGKKAMESFIQSCFESSAWTAVNLLGVNGGYAVRKPEHVAAIPYAGNEIILSCLLYEDETFMPRKPDIESELAQVVVLRVEQCLQGFEQFKDMGFTVSQGRPEVNTQIRDASVLFTMDIYIHSERTALEDSVRSFRFELPLELNSILMTASEIVIKAARNQEQASEAMKAVIEQAIGKRLDFSPAFITTINPEMPTSYEFYNSTTMVWSIRQKTLYGNYSFLFATVFG